MSKEKLNRVKRIKTEQTRLSKIFTELEEDKRSSAQGLISRAAFLLVSLEDYEDDINIGGSVESFQQSEHLPPYERARPVVQQYNSANKLYQTIIKQLTDMLPEKDKNDSNASLMKGLIKPD